MNKNLQELTDKIYKEGVEKARQESAELIEKARTEAREIIRSAEEHAQEIIERAQKESEDLRKKNDAEMRLSSRQALSSLKQTITDLLIWKVTSAPLKEAFDDQEFIKRIIDKLVDNWIQSDFGQEERLNVLLPEKYMGALQQYFADRAQETLKNGVVIDFKGKMKDGFQISPEGGTFKVNFTSEDFENYFKTYARPRVIRMLFGEEK